MRIAGLVLAGGRSRRFGAEKATATLGGAPLIAHAAAALSGGCETLAVSASPGSGAAAWAIAAGATVLTDPPDAAQGPLAGVREGLRWATSLGCDALATAPCDTPRLPPDLAPRLAAALADGPRAGAAFAVTPEGPHPLCALWRTGALGGLDVALEGGRHPPVREVLAALSAVQVAFADAAAFANLNTREDLAASLRPRLSPGT